MRNGGGAFQRDGPRTGSTVAEQELYRNTSPCSFSTCVPNERSPFVEKGEDAQRRKRVAVNACNFLFYPGDAGLTPGLQYPVFVSLALLHAGCFI